MDASANKRRASRLSEGTTARKLDYGITYAGKAAAAEIIGGQVAATRRVLAVREDASVSPSRLYLGENLDILRALLNDRQVCGKVALAYIDPPFATGASFETRGAVGAYHDHAVGAEFIEFLRQRIIVLREILSPTGSVYVHLDAKMAFPIKVIMDEVFGPGCFRNWITRKKSNRKNSTTKQFGNIADYILFYAKTDSYTFNRPYEPWTDEWVKREYPCVEDGTGRRYKKVPVHAPGKRNGATGGPWRGKLPPAGKHWQFAPSTLDEMDARGEIYWSPTNNPRRKLYFDKSEGVAVQDIWTEFRDAHNQMVEVTGYPTEKNLDMLKRIVAASSNADDLVMDCFCGSGTTLAAAEALGRRWVGIDASRTAIETTLKRFGQGSERMGDFVKGKAKKKPSLFGATGLMRTGFDLYAAGLTDPSDEEFFRRWAEFFSCSTTTPV